MANVFVFVYENKAMKFVEIVLKGTGEVREKDDGVNLPKIHCKHICKCHYESSVHYNMLKFNKWQKE
jgi:hypothetical protein